MCAFNSLESRLCIVDVLISHWNELTVEDGSLVELSFSSFLVTRLTCVSTPLKWKILLLDILWPYIRLVDFYYFMISTWRCKCTYITWKKLVVKLAIHEKRKSFITTKINSFQMFQMVGFSIKMNDQMYHYIKGRENTISNWQKVVVILVSDCLIHFHHNP